MPATPARSFGVGDDGVARNECRVRCKNSNDSAAQRLRGDRFIAKIMFRRGAFFLKLALHHWLIEKQAEELDPHPLANYRAINRSRHGRMQMIKPRSALATEYFSPKRA
jgi:hypothetical protein